MKGPSRPEGDLQVPNARGVEGSEGNFHGPKVLHTKPSSPPDT